MAGEAHQHQAIVESARRSLAHQRQGGRRVQSIGRGSANLKRKTLMRRIKLILASVAAILIAAGVIGLAIDGIGFAGVMLTALAIVVAVLVFSNFPRTKVPRREDLNRGDVRQMVGRTEFWLEHQRAALPPAAADIVDRIGLQLDELGLQLEGVDPAHPAAVETRKLVGETLPEMVDAYRRIPAHLRREQRAGGAPDQQIVGSLGKISAEIDEITRQLADGALDDLAIRARYLEYKYGSGTDPTGGALMRVAIPHDLDRQTVRDRLRTNGHRIADHMPGGLADVTTTWPSADRMAMAITVMGQSLAGHVDIEERQLVIVVELPPALGFVGPLVEGAIRQQGHRLLAPPAG